MMTSWRIKNFKAWQDTGSIKLAPLTVFFGENSAGKSSLGQLLLALKQSAGSAAAQSSLNFGDGQSLIDLGSFAQNLHGGQLTEPLQLYVQGRSVVMLGMHGETPASVGRAGEAAILPFWLLMLSSASYSLPSINPSWIFSRALPIGCSRWVWPLILRFAL